MRQPACRRSFMQRARVGRQRVLDRQALDWRDLIHLASDHIRCYQPNRTITVKGLEAPAPFEGDPLLLEQMLLILICNAAKYSPADSAIEITGQVGATHVTISIRDYGIGIPKDDLQQIFQPFFRSRNAASLEGTGLGLNLADRILRLHGGSIQVQSQEGHGSTFTILLPRTHSRC